MSSARWHFGLPSLAVSPDGPTAAVLMLHLYNAWNVVSVSRNTRVLSSYIIPGSGPSARRLVLNGSYKPAWERAPALKAAPPWLRTSLFDRGIVPHYAHEMRAEQQPSHAHAWDAFAQHLDPDVANAMRVTECYDQRFYQWMMEAPETRTRRAQAATTYPNLIAYFQLPAITQAIDEGLSPVKALHFTRKGHIPPRVFAAFGKSTTLPDDLAIPSRYNAPGYDQILKLLSACDGTWTPSTPTEWRAMYHLALEAQDYKSLKLTTAALLSALSKPLPTPDQRWSRMHRRLPHVIDVEDWGTELHTGMRLAPYATRDVLRHLVSTTSLRDVLHATRTYHEPDELLAYRARKAAVTNGDPHETWPAPTPPIRFTQDRETVHIVPISTPAPLTRLGIIQQHCVWTYPPHCRSGRSMIVALIPDSLVRNHLGSDHYPSPRQRQETMMDLVTRLGADYAAHVVTAEVQDNGAPQLVQAQSLGKRPLTELEEKALAWYVDAVLAFNPTARANRAVLAERLRTRPEHDTSDFDALDPEQCHRAFLAARPLSPTHAGRVAPTRNDWLDVYGLKDCARDERRE